MIVLALVNFPLTYLFTHFADGIAANRSVVYTMTVDVLQGKPLCLKLIMF